ncbi:histone-like nucleoid-structuring protein Lsr2 [Jatrophihabitans fulvus]
MAQKTVVTLIDDLDNSKADETVSFSLDGASYEIDLSSSNAAELRDVMAKYVANARRASGRGPRTNGTGAVKRGRPARGDREQTQAIREWARNHDYKVGEKGRIPAHIVEAYNAQN